MDVSIILVSYNTAESLSACLARIREATANLRHEVIVVDNASRDHSAALVRSRHPDCRLIENAENHGFGRACNQALQWASGRYVLLINPDAFVEPDGISKTVAFLDANPDCGVLGVKLVGPDGRLQPSARYFPTPWNTFLQRTGLDRFFKGARMIDDMSWDHASVRYCDWVPGCYFLVRKAVIDQIGLFDRRYFLYYEEVDHCLAAKKSGWRVVYFPGTQVVHMRGESAKIDGEVTRSGHHQLESARIESELLYFRKNHGPGGAGTYVLLTTLGDALRFLGKLVRGRISPELRACAAHATLVWSLYRRTAWGTCATR